MSDLFTSYLLSFKTGNKADEFKFIWDLYAKPESNEVISLRNQLLSGETINFQTCPTVFAGKEIAKSTINRCARNSIVLFGKKGLNSLRNFYEEIDFRDAELHEIESLTGDKLTHIIESCKDEKIKFILGIGGGQAIDYANFIANKVGKFCVAIPTSLSTHVYASPKIHAAKAIKEVGYKVTIDGAPPQLGVLDIGFLESVQSKDAKLIRAGLGDVMAFMSAVHDWKLAERHGKDEVNSVVVKITEDIINRMHEFDVSKPLGTWIKEYSLIQVALCYMTGWVGSPPASGSEHLFARVAEEYTDALHGELVAVATLMAKYLQGREHTDVANLINHLGLTRSLSDLGLTKDSAAEIWSKSLAVGVEKSRFTVLDVLNPPKEEYNKMLTELINTGAILE